MAWVSRLRPSSEGSWKAEPGLRGLKDVGPVPKGFVLAGMFPDKPQREGPKGYYTAPRGAANPGAGDGVAKGRGPRSGGPRPRGSTRIQEQLELARHLKEADFEPLHTRYRVAHSLR